jgi:putative ABC transport system ATP-binding protein
MTTAIETQYVAEAEQISREYRSGGNIVHALRGVSLAIRPGELVIVRGRSGSGKTTLLNILTGLDNPTQGQVRIAGREVAPLGETARALLRREHVGMMFQNAHLIPLLTAQENVEVPLRLSHLKPASARTERAHRALDLVGLMPRARHRGMELSGGEQQRVALARAIVASPSFVVADEPTGNLDSQTARDIAGLLRELAHQERMGFLVATHDATVVSAADRVLVMQDGVLSEA